MKILKGEHFTFYGELAKFVNDNKIKREDILCIVADGDGSLLTLFYYAE